MTTLYFVLILAVVASATAHPVEESRVKRQALGGESLQDPNDPKYKKLAEESFEKYRVTNPGGQINVKDLKVTKVTTQVVAGSKTRIDFTVTPTNGDVITCHSEIFEQAWLNKKEIDVNCNLNQQKSKVKRQVPGGETEQDANDPKYKALAQESFEKYRTTNPGGQITPKELKVTKVTTAVVAGTMTSLDFTVTPTNGEDIACHSEIWEQPWIQKKEIKVDCNLNKSQSKVKRQIAGGEMEQDPNTEENKKLAQESLEKYSETNPGGPIKAKRIKVTKVTTQVVSGVMTRLTFTVEPVNGEEFTCHSKVWEQSWHNMKDFTVTCDLKREQSRGKRQVPGGIASQDANDPVYKKLAQESFEKYLATNPGGEIDVKDLKVTKVTKQVVAGSRTLIDFTITPTNGEAITCHSEIIEQKWLNNKEITVDCDVNQQKSKVRRQIPGGEEEKDPNDEKYKQLADESLEKFSETNPGGPIKAKQIKVTKVTSQVVSGSLTLITFTVEPANGEEFTCHSKVWEQPWLNKKEITVTCDLKDQELSRVKRQVPGGVILQNPNDPTYKQLAQESFEKYLTTTPGGHVDVEILIITRVTRQVVAGLKTVMDFFQSKMSVPGGQSERDPNDPKYMQLAQESFTKYCETNPGGPIDVKEIKVTKVTHQVVAGSMTRITFTVEPTDGEIFTCYAKIWEQPWLNKKEIEVTCEPDDYQTEISYGYGTGEQEEQDPSDPKYQNMAEEVVRFHLNVTKQDTKKVTVSKVTTQVVAGLLTRIQFRVFLVNGKSALCNSEIWDQSWKDLRVVTFKCDSLFSNKRLSSRVNSRIAVTRNPKNPKYLNLANEALDVFLKTRGSKLFNKEDVKSVSVTSVKVKIGSQITNALVFDVTTLNNGKFECEGVVLESPWKALDMVEVTNVNCDISKGDATKGLLTGQSGKNKQIGGQVRQNPNDSKYKRLAEESFKRYLQSHTNIKISVKKLTVDTVTTQVVAGTMIRIDFHVDPNKGSRIPCKSEIWEKVDDKLDFNVMCQLNGEKVGGQNEQDPEDPKYKQLAEESFQKYRHTHIGPLFVVKEIKVTRVTTQVVAGVATKLDFNVITDSNLRYHCHSEVLEQPWRQIKDITVMCDPLNKLSASANSPKLNDDVDERVGGQTNEDPKDPKYKKLAEESFKRYLQSHTNIKISVKKLTVDTVTTQVVAGTMIRIDFHVDPNKGSRIPCKSEIWEKVDDKLDFNVMCQLNGEKVGAQNEQDPEDPKYKQLAEESFQKYRHTYIGPLFVVKEIKVTRVTTQVVAGVATKLDFNVITDSNLRYHCHSKVLEQTWRQIKDITVMCYPLNKLSAFANSPKLNDDVDERVGGQTNEDPKDPKYKKLAEESFKRYLQSHINVKISVKKLTVDTVTTQVVAGTMIRIDFHVDPNKGSRIPCKSEIWEKVDDKFDFNVMCQLNGEKVGGQDEQDPEDPKYKQLAQESFHKYRHTHIGPLFHVKEIKVTRVTTQVVAGVATKLDFNVITDSDLRYHCHSEVLEQPWLQNKNIEVNCFSPSKLTLSKSASRLKVKGGINIIDEAIADYFEKFDHQQWTVENSVIRSSNKTRTRYGKEDISYSKVDVFASTRNGDYSYYNCSAVFATNKLNEEIPIGVNCNKHTSLLGRTDWRDPSDKMFLTLAQNAIKQYMRTTNNKVGLRGRYDVVVTFAASSLAAGRWYAINFVVRPLKADVNGLKCYTRVWEDLKGKQTITEVTCDYNNTNQKRYKSLKLYYNRAHRISMHLNILLLFLLTSGWVCYGDETNRIIGGVQEQDASDPKYQNMANELVHYYLNVRDQDKKNVTVIKVTTQVVSGIITKIQLRLFLVSGKSTTCDFKIWEQKWKDVKHVTHKCDSVFLEKLSSSNLHRPEKDRNPTNLKYQNIAQVSIDTLFESPGRKPFEKKDIKEISVGKTKVEINAEIKITVEIHVITVNNDHFKCTSRVIEAPWSLENPAKITEVNCTKANGDTENEPGGLESQNPKDPQYKELAIESLKNFEQIDNLKQVNVTKVTTQVVSVIITRIDFTVIPIKGESYSCHSEIIGKITVSTKIFKVSCDKKDSSKMPGSLIPQNPEDPKYKQLAMESFENYQQTNDFIGFKTLKVTKVTTQEISGIITQLEFIVVPTKGKSFACRSQIIEQKWVHNKVISVTCDRQKNPQIPGGLVPQNPNDPKFKQLAMESFQNYQETNGLIGFKKLKVTKVTTQVVSGIITQLEYIVVPNKGKSFACRSQIIEQKWVHNKVISVTCDRQKNPQIPGGLVPQNPNDPKYKQLATESFEKYQQTNGFVKIKKLKVNKVTTQVVSGVITSIYFNVIPKRGKSFACCSQIIEQKWVHNKIITVTCDRQNNLLDTGGLVPQNPNDPKYKPLAIKSFKQHQKTYRYVKVKDIKVTKVTTEKVPGFITRIEFDVIPITGKSLSCRSELVQQNWVTSITCYRKKYPLVPGGELSQNPDLLKYKNLAKESFKKFQETNGVTIVKHIKVHKVTTQVVAIAGIITRIDFTVTPIKGEPLICNSEIFEQKWVQGKNIIKVNCEISQNPDNPKSKVGSEDEQNPDNLSTTN
ncbi:uncharacterized protein LOC134656047 [Cydia amplana]|uniref:uncharacterized protein LOC134656047 n=1 Tax=Cydia amplana TaxID=1869771 RepID=UPI002FE535A7